MRPRHPLSRLLPFVVGALLLVGCRDGSRRSDLVPLGSIASTAPGSSGGSANWQAMRFETIDVGSLSNYGIGRGQETLLVTNDADWRALWAQHSSGPLPPVDFSRSSVVAAFMGQMGGGGHFTRIVRLERDTNGPDLRALVREFRVAPWKPNTRNITAPYEIVKSLDGKAGSGGSLVVHRQDLLDFSVWRAGAHSGIGANDPNFKGDVRLLRNDAELTAFYAQHAPGTKPPAVDWKQEMVVAVLGGFQPTSGHSVRTRRLLLDRATGELRVHYEVDPYRGGAKPLPVTETPFQILRVVQAPVASVRPEQLSLLKTRTLLRTTQSRYAGKEEILVIRDKAAFDAMWRKRIGGTPPVIDFRSEQVVAAFYGRKATGGYTIAVGRARTYEDGDLDLTIWTTVPNGPAIQVITSPAHVVALPRTEGPWTFEKIDVTPVP